MCWFLSKGERRISGDVMIKIKQQAIKDCNITVPGSKSYTHRLLIATALADGKCTISNCLKSEDTKLTMAALKQMGIKIEETNNITTVWGNNGKLNSCTEPIYLANSGTSMRLLTSIAALGIGRYILTGTKRMQERPIQDLLNGLNQINILAKSIKNTDAPPIEIIGKNENTEKITGGSMILNCNISSQFLSSVLLMAPCTKDGIQIKIEDKIVSKPYIDMTIDIMEKSGITVQRDGYQSFFVQGCQEYQNGNYFVEPDCSQAGYFWAAAAICGKKIKVNNISINSHQGDVQFTNVLKNMGCDVQFEKDGITVTGGKLKGIEVDMSHMPDIVPTLAVVASFATGTTVIKNVAHLKEKECDRLKSVATELIKMGVKAVATESGLIIEGTTPKGASIKTYDDHRMAMCFAVAGLKVPGVIIEDEKCVEKSFPNFWEVFEKLYV